MSAVLAVLIATAIRWTLHPILGDRLPLITYVFALVFSASYGGLGPALLALALSGLATLAVLPGRDGGQGMAGLTAWVGFGGYVLFALMIALMSEWSRASWRRAGESDRRLRELLDAEQESRERLAITLRSIGDAVIATDAGGLVVAINPVAEGLTGWSAGEATGRPLHEVFRIVDEATGEPSETPVARVLREGCVVGLANHTALIARDGTTRSIDDSAAPIRDGGGAIRGVVLCFRDVAEQRKSERALRASEERHRRIAELTSDYAVSGRVEEDGQVVFGDATEGFVKVTGYTLEEMEALGGWPILVHPEDLPLVHGTFERMLAGQPAGCEIRIITKGGEVRWLHYLGRGIHDPARGRVTRVHIAAQDITERTRAEATIAEQIRLAEFGRDVGLAITESLSLQETLNRCVKTTVRHLDGAFARIWTVDKAGEVLELQASAGLYTHTDGPHGRVPVGRYKIGKIARDRVPHLTNSVIGDPLVPDQDWAGREGMVAFAGYPLVVGDRLVGVWAMFARHELSEATLRAMESVATGIALGIERRRAQEALAQSEAWLATTLASIGDAVIATDGQARVRFMNPVAERLTGWSKEEAVGRPMEEVFRIVNEHTRQPAEHPVARVIREGIVVGLANHTVLIGRGGAETPIEDSAAPIRDDQGEVQGVVMIFRDVTRERASRTLLKESEARKAAILQTALDAIVTIDHRGKLVEWNPAAERIFGLDKAAVLGREMSELIIPEPLRDAHRKGMAHHLATGEGPVLGKRIEITALRADGSIFPIELAITPISTDGPPLFTAHVRDISERKQAEEALRDSEERFRTMADSIPQLVWMARPDGHIYWYNRRWFEYTGTIPEQMEGWGWQSVHHPDTLPIVMEQWKASVANGEPFDMVFPLRAADGTYRPFLTRVMPVRDEGGQVAHWFGTNTDIADRLRIEEELRAAKEEAEGASRAKTQFLAVLSHELRTPLNPILLATTAMLERPADPGEIRPTLEMIRQNVNLQARLIDDLLDVMRIVRGKMPLHWEIADGHMLIDQAIQICHSEVFGGGLRLQQELAAEHHHINADPARLQQVFWNLIKNAVKFTPAGGEITVRTRNEEGQDGRRDRLVIEVADTGIGIEPDVLPRIFEPFQQGETTITRKFGGLGLGLAIGRGIVEGHGGTLDAQSEGKDRGTTFRVELRAIPASQIQANRPPTDGPSGADRASPRRILVVEDEQTTRRLMARLLGGLGHEVTTADTIGAALEALEAGGFDLIVSDIGLPDGSGLDLMRRTVATRGRVLAIALTGYGMEDDIRRSHEAGFTAHMTKPIDFAKLEAMIRQITA